MAAYGDGIEEVVRVEAAMAAGWVADASPDISSAAGRSSFTCGGSGRARRSHAAAREKGMEPLGGPAGRNTPWRRRPSRGEENTRDRARGVRCAEFVCCDPRG